MKQREIWLIRVLLTLVPIYKQEAVDEGTWRKFYILGTLEDELAVMSVEDYLQMIDEAKADFEEDIVNQVHVAEQRLSSAFFGMHFMY